MEANGKKFLVVWGENQHDKNDCGYEVFSIDFLVEHEVLIDDEILSVNGLEVGQAWTRTELSGSLSVCRIK
jgi:proteasome assembly chaperone (PAC2) family protein